MNSKTPTTQSHSASLTHQAARANKDSHSLLPAQSGFSSQNTHKSLQKKNSSHIAKGLTALAITFAMLLSACGGSTDQETSASASDTTATATDSATDAQNNEADSTADNNSAAEQTNDGTEQNNAEQDGAEQDGAEQDGAEQDSSNTASQSSTYSDEKPSVDASFLGKFDQLSMTDITEGVGQTATRGSIISVHYVGVLASDGTEFDSSWNYGRPFEFLLGAGQVIQGWDMGFLDMKEGGRRVIQIPAELGYGEASAGSIPPNSDLVFVVDLISVSTADESAAAAAAPDALPSPEIPETALGSFDELAIIDLVVGEGPTAQKGDLASVQYVGVNADDGQEFDSTYSRGGEAFPLIIGDGPVIDGWNEGLIGMKLGGERILQIPADKAYGDRDLVFLVKLENLTEAPLSHSTELAAPAPSKLDIQTLQEGSGDELKAGDSISAHVVIRSHETGQIFHSTYLYNVTDNLVIADETNPFPFLVEALVGAKVGEIRQVSLPAVEVFAGEDVEDYGLTETDAIAFIVEVVAQN